MSNKFSKFGGADMSTKKPASPKEMQSVDILMSEPFLQVASLFESAFKSDKISLVEIFRLNNKAKELGPEVTDMLEEVISRATNGDLTILENPIVSKIYSVLKG